MDSDGWDETGGMSVDSDLESFVELTLTLLWYIMHAWGRQQIIKYQIPHGMLTKTHKTIFCAQVTRDHQIGSRMGFAGACVSVCVCLPKLPAKWGKTQAAKASQIWRAAKTKPTHQSSSPQLRWRSFAPAWVYGACDKWTKRRRVQTIWLAYLRWGCTVPGRGRTGSSELLALSSKSSRRA